MSPECSSTCGWSRWAMRRSALSGSPWEPVEMTTTLWSGKLSISRGLDEHPLGHVDVAQRAADVRVLAHRAADEADLAVQVRRGGVDDLLHAVDVRREARDDDAALAAAEDVLQVRADDRLAGGEARAVGVRRVAAEQQQALAAELGQAGDVGGHAVDGRLVELVVAGDEDRAELGGQGDGAARPGSSASCGSARRRTGRPRAARRPCTSMTSTSLASCARRAWSAPSPSSAGRRRPGSSWRRARAGGRAGRRGGPRGRG